MVQKMPISGFKWVQNLTQTDIENYDADSDIGYLIEVDIDFPESVHDKLSNYCLAAEKLDITEKIASPTSLKIREKRVGKAQKFSSVKLTANLLPKQKYICHVRNLQFYLTQGAVLTKIHRVLQFNQVNLVLRNLEDI